MTMEPDRTAAALAPFIADHYSKTGQDLAADAAADETLLCLAAIYAELPALAQEAGEASARAGNRSRPGNGRHLCREANELLTETGNAIQHRLQTLAERNQRNARERSGRASPPGRA